MTRLTVAIAALAVIAGTGGLAQAKGSKRETPGIDPTARKQWEAHLTKLQGKPPAAIVNIQNLWTHEVMAIDAKTKPGSSIDEPTMAKFLRCHYTNSPTKMDPRLFNVLIGAAVRFKAVKVEIVSAFRAPKFNLMLRKKGREVAPDSQHTRGHAVDFRVPGVGTSQLLRYVQSLRLGGAGYYPHSEFVHADVGPVRFWTGR